MKKTLLLLAVALCAAGCQLAAPEDEGPAIEDRLAAQQAISEADTLFDRGKFYKAYKAYEKGLRLYMRHPRREEIVRREIEEIGLKFLDGTIKVGWFGTGFLARPRPGLGEEIVRAVVLRHSKQGYEFLADAQYRLATHIFERRRYGEAEIEFKFLIKNFKDSYWTTISEFLLAESLYLQNQGAKFDKGTLDDAQEHYMIFLEKSAAGPASEDERAARARERLETIRNTKAEKEYLKGRFYFEQRQYRAAAAVLREVAPQYPGTVWAERSDALLARAQEKIDKER